MKKLQKNIIATNEDALKNDGRIKLYLKNDISFNQDVLDAIRLICSLRKNPNLDYSREINDNDNCYFARKIIYTICHYPVYAKNDGLCRYGYPDEFYNYGTEDEYDNYTKSTAKIQQFVDYERPLYQKLGYQNVFDTSVKLLTGLKDENKCYPEQIGFREHLDAAVLAAQLYCPDKNVDTEMLIDHIKNKVHSWDSVLNRLIDLEEYDPQMFKKHLLTKRFAAEVAKKPKRAPRDIVAEKRLMAECAAAGDWDYEI